MDSTTYTNYTNELYFSHIDQDDPRFMLLFDHSLYSAHPSTPVYDIIPPGYSTASRINATAKGITAINSALLHPSATSQIPKLVPLVDGIYIVTYKVQPYDTFYYTQNVFRTQMIERSLDEIYAKAESNTNHAWYNRWKTDLLNISFMLATARALTRLNILREASDIFAEAQVETQRLVRIAQKLTV